ncbi:DNA polymerase III subunit gamma/tau [Criblamydia sequanensis]|uniref:DNA polymerase III subunit gamma/tau n=1 Tax=Candidatus Criblamydia sequanensis CRIB-18 TaxID=1437425 RepID=A0A090DXL0_9BACT|nr:DNA polymerase III subunit gamma/tau [Criblamydia sequanensis]CDR33539.1 DNA polymerase III, gamma and tau subunits [Criblamydia sequanensis CRIB-18]
MSGYQVLSRRYRPQIFKEVIGQESIVTTLKNAIKFKRIANAYLFSGSRGTGKTTLARIFAKAINCPNLNDEFEPCNTCSSCKEIASGNSLDVLEIDGASHRGIDDVRDINETVGYTASRGGYKIYIIDEVHMLTKEAFNALLKTLEEPPEKVKFFFATTEPQKVLPTIISRCQRFNLKRIPLDKIVYKLKMMTSSLGIQAESEALSMVAKRAEGGLRDAESLLDQVISFHEGDITKQAVSEVLGIMNTECLYAFDKAGKEGSFDYAFELAHELFSGGKDALHFIDMLVHHFRNILLVKIASKDSFHIDIPQEEKEALLLSASFYSKEQCLDILDYLVQEQNEIKNRPSLRVAIETILLHIMRTHQRLPIEVLVRRLVELEVEMNKIDVSAKSENKIKDERENLKTLLEVETKESDKKIDAKIAEVIKEKAPLPSIEIKETVIDLFMEPEPKTPPLSYSEPDFLKANPSKPIKAKEDVVLNPPYFYDTLLQFAAVELKGKMQRIHNQN